MKRIQLEGYVFRPMDLLFMLTLPFQLRWIRSVVTSKMIAVLFETHVLSSYEYTPRMVAEIDAKSFVLMYVFLALLWMVVRSVRNLLLFATSPSIDQSPVIPWLQLLLVLYLCYTSLVAGNLILFEDRWLQLYGEYVDLRVPVFDPVIRMSYVQWIAEGLYLLAALLPGWRRRFLLRRDPEHFRRHVQFLRRLRAPEPSSFRS